MFFVPRDGIKTMALADNALKACEKATAANQGS